jgi:putative DNA primase/helicase
MTTTNDAVAWHGAGFTHLVSIIPPDGILSPGSRIHVDARGKAPALLRSDATWSGYGWRVHQPSTDDVRQWVRQGANIGLNTEYFPAVDIDCSDAAMADELDAMAREVFGDSPRRIGRYPKRLLLYRTREPFTRGRLNMVGPDKVTKHLIEVLCQGQQFVAFGVHPATRSSYQWVPDLPSSPDVLNEITAEDVRVYLAAVKERWEARGWACRMDGAGAPMEPGQSSTQHLAPSFTALADAVSHIPNTSEAFPSRDAYLTMGYAIKASATVEQDEDAFSLFLDWCGRWDNGVNDPSTARDDWRRAVPPYRVGWDYLSSLAKQYGYDDAANDFAPLDTASVSVTPAPLFGTDHYLAAKMVDVLGQRLRYAPELDRWYVWDGSVWSPNAILQAEAMVNRELIVQADKVARMGATTDEKKKYYKIAEAFLSSARASSVRKVMESDPALAIGIASFDSDPWLLNTPNGLVDLRTGTLKPADPAKLASKRTSCTPEFDRACPTWIRFLNETTGHDQEFIDYLQRFAGYCLTGLVNEQCLLFVWGGGGNGKSVFLNVLSGILADYARVAPGDVFTQSFGERHSTEIAMLAGARLVVASEIEHGKKWNQVRVKSLTGGEKVTARFMRQDDFTFMPTFKILMAGNARPSVTNLDQAMRRRLRFVPFLHQPLRVDQHLGEKLEGEYPAILAWMIRGCLTWKKDGLGTTPVVTKSTEDYFEDEDILQEWLRVSVRGGTGKDFVKSRDLWASYQSWCRQCGEEPGHERSLVQKLTALGFNHGRGPKAERGFHGLKLVQDDLADLL